jgi:hypothetical protein
MLAKNVSAQFIENVLLFLTWYEFLFHTLKVELKADRIKQ